MVWKRWVGGPLWSAAVLAALVFGVAACGGGDDQGAENSSTTADAAAANGVEEVAPPGGYITDLVKYVNGKPGSADKNLPPVKVGWSSNDAGGSIESFAPQATDAAQVTVDWINKYASGIGGHPLILEECPVLNAEEEGQACAQQFLADDDISVISFGALSVGGATISSVVDGRKPILEGSSLTPSNIRGKNLWSLFSAFAFGTYAYGTFATSQTFNADKVAIVYREAPGASVEVQGATVAAKAGGAKTVKAVPVDAEATDLLGAYTAAGAQAADITIALVSSPAQCLASAKALESLRIDSAKVLWRPSCNQPEIRGQLPGGDYPKFYSTLIQSGDNLVRNPTGKAYVDALSKFGAEDHATDGWYSLIFGQVMTIAKFLNNIGYEKITPEAVIDQVQKWRGPQLLGGTKIECGRFKFAPANCSSGAYLFRHLGNDKWVRVSQWTEPPEPLMSHLETLPADGDFPTTWPPK